MAHHCAPRRQQGHPALQNGNTLKSSTVDWCWKFKLHILIYTTREGKKAKKKSNPRQKHPQCFQWIMFTCVSSYTNSSLVEGHRPQSTTKSLKALYTQLTTRSHSQGSKYCGLVTALGVWYWGTRRPLDICIRCPRSVWYRHLKGDVTQTAFKGRIWRWRGDRWCRTKTFTQKTGVQVP